MPRDIQFKDLAEACKPAKKAKPELTREETLAEIERRGRLLKHKRLLLQDVTKEVVKLQREQIRHRDDVAILEQEILRLSATIHPVTVVTSKAKTPRPKTKEELLREEAQEMLMTMSKEEVAYVLEQMQKEKE